MASLGQTSCAQGRATMTTGRLHYSKAPSFTTRARQTKLRRLLARSGCQPRDGFGSGETETGTGTDGVAVPRTTREESGQQRTPRRQVLANTSAMALAALAFQGRTDSANALPSTSGLAAEEDAVVAIFRANTPSVVFITNNQLMRNNRLDIMDVPVGTGSGFVWDYDGHVITNYHVIAGASTLQVTTQTPTPQGKVYTQSYAANVVGFDDDKDIAVLKLQGISPQEMKQMVPIQVGRSEKLLVGQTVFAIGNPFGLDHTMTSGIISGLGRVIQSQTGKPIRGAIQTDAAINPGNSGGPLLNKFGQLIGINTAILDPSGRGANAGVGFAIPVDTVKGIVQQIIQYGKIVRPYLGITLAPDSAVYQLGKKGVLVLDVPKGSPAMGKLMPTYRTGFGQLVLGDIIVAINNNYIDSSADLFNELDGLSVGDKVKLKVDRNNEETEVLVTLGSRVTTFES